MTDAETLALSQQIVDACRKMNATGLNQGTAGNVSARCGDGFLLTPTSLPYDIMQPEDIVMMSFDGTYEGRHRPSSEWRFHRDILRERPDINAVLHCHSMYATTVAIHCKPIPACHYVVGLAGGSNIRCAEYATFGTQQLSENALEALRDRKACLLAHHGQISLGRSPMEALNLAVEVEALARMYVQALSIGEPPILSEEEMARVIEQMHRMSYGLPPDLDGVNDTPREGGAVPH